jgi:hypothetical protein
MNLDQAIFGLLAVNVFVIFMCLFYKFFCGIIGK